MLISLFSEVYCVKYACLGELYTSKVDATEGFSKILYQNMPVIPDNGEVPDTFDYPGLRPLLVHCTRETKN